MKTSPISLRVRITGLKGAMRALRKLDQVVQNRVLTKAVRAGAAVIVKEAKSRAPKDLGALRRSIGTRMKKYRGSKSIYFAIGPRTKRREVLTTKAGRKVVRWPTKTAHLVEYGTAHSRPRPFMRPAYDATRSRVRAEIAQRIWDEIRREAQKARELP